MTRRMLLPILMAALVFVLVSPATYHAQLLADDTVTAPTTPATDPAAQGTPSTGDLKTTDASGSTVSCSTIAEAQGGVLLGYIVPCVAQTIGVTTQKFSASVIEWLEPLFYSFLTFVLVMFGVKVVQSDRADVYKEGILLLLKVTIVIGVFNMIPDVIVPGMYAAMDNAQSIVAGALGPTSTASISCDISKYQGAQTPLVWAQMDCIMGKMYGFTSGTSGGPGGGSSHNMFLAASVLGTLGGFFFGGFFGLVGVLVSLFLLVLRTAGAFIQGYLLICIMLIISPLFLPLVFLRATSNYFENWWKNIMAGFLMPVLITSYAMFALMLYDKMLFAQQTTDASGNVTHEGALINKLFDYSALKDAEQAPHQACDKQVAGNPAAARGGTDMNALMSIPFLQNIMGSFLSGSNNLCAGMNLPTLNLKEDPTGFGDAKNAFNQIFHDCMKLMILGYIITKGMEMVMNAIRMLTGSSAATMLLSATPGVERKIQGAIASAKQGAINSVGNSTGGEFLGKLRQDALSGATRGFFTGLSGDQ